MNNKKVHEILETFEKMCEYFEREPIDILFDGVYYFISRGSKEIIDVINQKYNVRIKVLEDEE